MIEGVWGGRIVSESTLSSRINAARRAIGDSGEAQALIRTIARRGFRFVAEVTEPDLPGLPAAVPARRAGAPEAGRELLPQPRRGDAGGGDRRRRARAGARRQLADPCRARLDQPALGALLDRLAARNRLVRYDVRGSGLSDREVADISAEAFLRDLETVVDDDRRAALRLIGASQGAAVAIAYAALPPGAGDAAGDCGGYARGRNRRGQPEEREKAEAIMTLMRQGWGDPRSAFLQMPSARSTCRGARPGSSPGGWRRSGRAATARRRCASAPPATGST